MFAAIPRLIYLVPVNAHSARQTAPLSRRLASCGRKASQLCYQIVPSDGATVDLAGEGRNYALGVDGTLSRH